MSWEARLLLEALLEFNFWNRILLELEGAEYLAGLNKQWGGIDWDYIISLVLKQKWLLQPQKQQRRITTCFWSFSWAALRGKSQLVSHKKVPRITPTDPRFLSLTTLIAGSPRCPQLFSKACLDSLTPKKAVTGLWEKLSLSKFYWPSLGLCSCQVSPWGTGCPHRRARKQPTWTTQSRFRSIALQTSCCICT